MLVLGKINILLIEEEYLKQLFLNLEKLAKDNIDLDFTITYLSYVAEIHNYLGNY